MFWVDVTNADSSIKYGGGPIATGTRWTYRQRLSRAGEWSLEVPLSEPRLLEIELKRRLHCYIRRNGVLAWVGGGSIESKQRGLGSGGIPTMTISGPDTLRELGGVTVNFEVNALATPPRGELVLHSIMAVMPSWSYTIETGVPEITARFAHESALNALVATCEKVGYFFYLVPYTTSARTLTIAKTPQDSGIIATNLADPIAAEGNSAICLITDIEHVESSWDAVNQLRVYGAGDGQARFTMAAAVFWPNGGAITLPYAFTDVAGRAHSFVCDRTQSMITDTPAVSAYGLEEQAVAFKDIGPITSSAADFQAAAHTLVTAGVNQLVLQSFPQNTYRLSVAALRQDITPGELIHVRSRKVRDGITYLDIDEMLVIQEIGREIDLDGERVTDLVVSTTWKPPKTDANIVTDAIRKLNSIDAHPQIGPTENTLTYREDVDDDYGASFPFWLSNATLQINSIKLRFLLEPLRSSVKTIGSSVTGTVDIPSHHHAVNTNSHHHDVGNHTHQIQVAGTSNTSYPNIRVNTGTNQFVRDDNGSALLLNTYASSGAVTSDAGAGGVTTTDTDGSTAGVSLDLSGGITTQYGVFVDSPANTYAVGDLTWKVNGTTIATAPTAIAGLWYELNLTNNLTDLSTLRPLAYANTVTVEVTTPGAHKKVRVTAQIELRTTIQSIVAGI